MPTPEEIERIAHLYDVPPELVGIVSASTGDGDDTTVWTPVGASDGGFQMSLVRDEDGTTAVEIREHGAAEIQFNADEITAENLRRAFNGAGFGSGQVAAEHYGFRDSPRATPREINTTPFVMCDRAEIDERLATFRCVWCGNPLRAYNAADDTFCSEGCDTAWRANQVANYGSGGVHLDRNEIVPRDDPAEQRPAGAPAPQDPVHASRTADTPAIPEVTHSNTRVTTFRTATGMLILDGPYLPSEFEIYRQPGDGEGCYAVTMPSLPDHDPITVGPAHPSRTSQGTAIGHPRFFALPSLSDAAPPPMSASRWPLVQMANAERQGWRIALGEAADRGPITRPVRSCARCDHVGVPTAITAVFPGEATRIAASRPWFDDGNPEATRRMDCVELMLTRSTKLCCPACLLPYPGPTAVPLYRPPGAGALEEGVWELRVITHRWSQGMHVSDVAASHGGAHVGARTWGDLWDGALRGHHGWQCGVPGCGDGVHRWVLLAADMSWQGYLWRPVDNTPIRIPLCAGHRGRLVYDMHTYLYTSPHYDQARRLDHGMVDGDVRRFRIM